MINFRNDYSDICYPEILDAIKENLDQINQDTGLIATAKMLKN